LECLEHWYLISMADVFELSPVEKSSLEQIGKYNC
jgi:hypothetical protein